jgi:Tfp pilus assembly protein PilF
LSAVDAFHDCGRDMTSVSIMARLQRAVGMLQAGDASGALVEIDAALGEDPDDVESLHLNAMALGRAGRIDEAGLAFERAAAAHPKKDIVLTNFGNCLKNAGRLEESRRAYERAVAAAPQSADALNALGLACGQLGDFVAARAAFEKALSINPRHANALNNLATIEARANRHDLAVELLSRAIAAEPRLFSAWINRGSNLRLLARFDEALVDQQRAALLAPKLAEPHYQIAATFRTAGRIDEAIDAYRQALALGPLRADIHREFAGLMLETGHPEIAFEEFDKAIDATNSPDLAAARADITLISGDARTSARFCVRALGVNPNHPKANEVLARASRALGDFARALPAARLAFDHAPGDFEILHTCCEMEMATGDFASAVEKLKRDAPPKHLQKHIALKAIALRASGDASYRSLYDYDRFTAQIAIAPPPGYPSISAFNAALEKSIERLHRTTDRPVDQTLYGGTQSPGRLWNEPDPVIQTYVAAMREAAIAYVRQLPDDPGHPFLARKSESLDCVGAWSVILSSGGGHVDHIHPAGWISACYYVTSPPEIFEGERAGHLRLGASGIDGLPFPAERYYPPTPGTVVFFPSYVWHGVEPFEAGAHRVTAPFDLSPVG